MLRGLGQQSPTLGLITNLHFALTVQAVGPARFAILATALSESDPAQTAVIQASTDAAAAAAAAAAAILRAAKRAMSPRSISLRRRHSIRPDQLIGLILKCIWQIAKTKHLRS